MMAAPRHAAPRSGERRGAQPPALTRRGGNAALSRAAEGRARPYGTGRNTPAAEATPPSCVYSCSLAWLMMRPRPPAAICSRGALAAGAGGAPFAPLGSALLLSARRCRALRYPRCASGALCERWGSGSSRRRTAGREGGGGQGGAGPGGAAALGSPRLPHGRGLQGRPGAGEVPAGGGGRRRRGQVGAHHPVHPGEARRRGSPSRGAGEVPLRPAAAPGPGRCPARGAGREEGQEAPRVAGGRRRRDLEGPPGRRCGREGAAAASGLALPAASGWGGDGVRSASLRAAAGQGRASRAARLPRCRCAA